MRTLIIKDYSTKSSNYCLISNLLKRVWLSLFHQYWITYRWLDVHFPFYFITCMKVIRLTSLIFSWFINLHYSLFKIYIWALYSLSDYIAWANHSVSWDVHLTQFIKRTIYQHTCVCFSNLPKMFVAGQQNIKLFMIYTTTIKLKNLHYNTFNVVLP